MMSVLSLCTDAEMLESVPRDAFCSMGVDTGAELHVVVLKCDDDDAAKQHLIHLSVCHDFSDLDPLMKRFKVGRCVIDGLPEMHAARAFAKRNRGHVYLNFFNQHQRGAANWDRPARMVQVNRTEALDASRTAIRERKVVLPRRAPLVELFARHLAADAKILDEDEETGAKKFRYVRTGEDHFSLAFTYAWMAASDPSLVSQRRTLLSIRKGEGVIFA